MDSPRFFCDEDVSKNLIEALRKSEPAIDLLCVGEAVAPPLGTKDPDLLLAAEALGRIFLSNDRQSLPGHLIRHYAMGHQTHGIILMRTGHSTFAFMDEILLRWAATTSDEWLDRMQYIP